MTPRSPSSEVRSTLRGQGLLRAVAVVLLVAAAVAIGPGERPAAAIDQSKGHPGFCRTATGVTVVIDFQQLGGETYVRCFPSRNRATGLEALKGAGFQIEGVRRWGESFICRIENRPSAVETIAVEGDVGYREACLDTPPAAAYWSYWHAGNNCPWTYSQWGVKNRNVVPGGFEGWSFSLNATADSNPVPRIVPVRPGTEGQPCTTEPEAPPSSDDPNDQAPGVGGGSSGGSGGGPGGAGGPTGSGGAGPSGGSPGGGDVSDSAGTGGPDAVGSGASDPGDGSGGAGGGRSGSTGDGRPPPRPREATTAPTTVPAAEEGGEQAAALDPADDVAFSGGEDAPDVRDTLRDQQGGVWWAPWAATVAVVGLGSGIWWTNRRRRLAREA